MEYDVVFPSFFVIFFTLVVELDGSVSATHSIAFFLACSFHWRIFSFDTLRMSVCVKKNSSLTATTEEDVVT